MTMMIPDKNWWELDTYEQQAPLPEALLEPSIAGPNGYALVRVNPDGSTQRGWGLIGPEGQDGFMPRYLAGEFAERRALYAFEQREAPFAIVMRSTRLLCVDIDGKNGGLEHASELGALPFTLAEVSKSGQGYHLFYLVDEEWDELEGFGEIPDHIGIVTGVDIRSVGCVYHYPTQRWNERPLATLPTWLKERLLSRKQQREFAANTITKVLESLDETEILLMHTELIDELAKPIPQGRRNNTLFAIGSKLKQAQVPDWAELLRDRGLALSLSEDELDKIISNVETYGS